MNLEFLDGRTPIQALLQELLKEGEWYFRFELDKNDHVTVLFCIYKISIEMLRYYLWVLIIDCTYKTNQYCLPLLDIVGFTPTGISIYLGFAFVHNERTGTLEIVLEYLDTVYQKLGLDPPSTVLTDKEPGLINAIKAVWPNTDSMICIWHININLMKYALPILRAQIAEARKNSLLKLPDRTELPDESQIRIIKQQLEKKLAEILDEGWNKMLKCWQRIVYAETQSDFDNV